MRWILTVKQSSQCQSGITTDSSINTKHKQSMLFHSQADEMSTVLQSACNCQIPTNIDYSCD